MDWDLVTKSKFKIGDLVRVVEEMDMLLIDHVIPAGTVGLIVAIDPPDLHEITLWGIDYTVLIGGKTYLFFEMELELVADKPDPTPIPDNEFIFLKH